jgi:hypothetical protein
MRSLLTWFSVLLLSSVLWAQTAAKDAQPADQTQPATVTTEQIKALQDALAAQQKQIDEQRQQMEEQKQQIEALRQQLGESGTPHVTAASLHTTVGESSSRAVMGDAGESQETPKESPLSFRIGEMDFTPGGSVEFTNVFRTTNTGSAAFTGFNAIPFNNTVQGHITEFRMTGQASTLNLKVTGKLGANLITGFVEADFTGNDAANVFVTSNSHTNRLRLYWVDVRRGKWEFLGGQSWSWLTPNRVGLSPLPADIFYTENQDQHYQVGLPWTRAAQFRVAYHPSENWALGLAVENPEQYVATGEVVFPFVFNAQLGTQFNNNNNTAGIPNLAPNFIPKIAYDTEINGKHMHLEAMGLVTIAHATFLHIGAPGNPFEHTTSVGLAGGFGVNLEAAKGYRFVANGLWGYGDGRYLIGLGPDVVVHPIQENPTTLSVEISPVHAGSGMVGFEAQVTKNHMLSAYYGGVYFQRNAFPDVTSPLVVKPFIGFGGPSSPQSANRSIQEATLDWDYTIWQDRNYGALQLRTQWSYLTRAPWFVAAGAPKNAHLFMGWASVRYILP